MLVKRAFLLLVCLIILFYPAIVPVASACGHDSFYLGAGYTQLFMYTPESRLTSTAGDLGKISIGPGYGANFVLGYDLCGSRWGFQMPFEFTRQKLNHTEWVNQFGSSIEAVLHLAEWQNGMDVRLVGGAGWMYLTEGQVDDRSAALGITADFGPGVAYYFHRTKSLSMAAVLELPFRMIHYFGDHLSSGGTTIVAFPFRVSLQFGF